MRLPNGAASVRAEAWGETLHPVAGPVVEAHTLYVEQLDLVRRLREAGRPLVVWDVGIGAGANALSLCRATEGVTGTLRLLSFDLTLEALAFAVREAAVLGYPRGYEAWLEDLIRDRQVRFEHAGRVVEWSVHLGDFANELRRQAEMVSGWRPGPARDRQGNGADSMIRVRETDGVHLLTSVATANEEVTREGAEAERGGLWPCPDAILFDPYSPRRNPALWSLEVFEALRRCVSPDRPCMLATYSRSTGVRVGLLLAGFYVGCGRPVAGKEETTVACDRVELLEQPLDPAWLARAMRSSSAEPIRDGRYAAKPLSEPTRHRLSQHPQFMLRDSRDCSSGRWPMIEE